MVPTVMDQADEPRKRRRVDGVTKGAANSSPKKDGPRLSNIFEGLDICLLKGSCDSQGHAKQRKKLIRQHGGKCSFRPSSEVPH